jgi:hypothetical protein
MTVVSLNLASFDYFLVEKSLVASVIFLGQSHEYAYTVQMTSVLVSLQSGVFEASQWPEPTIRPSPTAYLPHRSSWPPFPILVLSVHQATSASAETPPSGAVPFRRLCP